MGKPRFSPGNRDRNEPEIVAVIKAAGIQFLRLSEGAGADLLLLTKPMVFVEVKNPTQRKSDRTLTEAERRLMVYCQEQGIDYHVVETEAEILTVCNFLRTRV